MSDSETSSDVNANINIYDSKGKVNSKSEQKKSSDTEYYMNLIANNNKTVPEKLEVSSESEILKSDSSSSSKKTSSIESKSSSSSSSKKSKNRYENIDLTPKPKVEKKPVESSVPQNVPFVSASLSPQEIRMKKIELLRKLSEIKTKGFSLTKDYDFNSSIEEMEYEYELLKSFVDKRNGIKIYKNILLNGVSVIEFLNDKYDPFDFHLQGWGEHMSIEVDSYDDVLEELYEKYKGSGKKMPPELKLCLLMVASAGAFHFSKSQSTIPGLEATLNKNPDLISKLLNPQKQQSQFMSEQELNIQRQRALIQQKEKELKEKKFTNPPVMPGPRATMTEPVASNQSSNKISLAGVPEIRAPTNVQDILNRIKQKQVANTDTQDESSSNNDRILSDVNVSDSKKGKKKAPSISISTK